MREFAEDSQVVAKFKEAALKRSHLPRGIIICYTMYLCIILCRVKFPHELSLLAFILIL